jgi:hypothetical protein
MAQLHFAGIAKVQGQIVSAVRCRLLRVGRHKNMTNECTPEHILKFFFRRTKEQ